MDELVARLSNGEHEVEASLRPERTVQELKEAIERKFVHVKFVNTRGGTELGVRLDATLTDTSGADFVTATGKVRVGGYLTLNYQPVRLLADIWLHDLKGTGKLEPCGDPVA